MIASLKKRLPYSVKLYLGNIRQARYGSKKHFKGVYDAYFDAPQSIGYNDPSWKLKSHSGAVRAQKMLSQRIPETAPSKHVLPIALSMLADTADREISVLDFGGAGGLDFGHARALTGGRVPIKYHVVDVEAACEGGRAAWEADARIAFSTVLPPVTEKFDVVYSYGAIHCVEKPLELLAAFCQYRPKCVVLCKHPVHDGKSFVRGQINLGKNLDLAQWVLSLSEIEDVMEENGYVLLFRAKGEDKYNVDNFPVNFRVEQTVNMVFVQRHVRAS